MHRDHIGKAWRALAFTCHKVEAEGLLLTRRRLPCTLQSLTLCAAADRELSAYQMWERVRLSHADEASGP
jgi:hypothetical protein